MITLNKNGYIFHSKDSVINQVKRQVPTGGGLEENYFRIKDITSTESEGKNIFCTNDSQKKAGAAIHIF